MRALFPLMLACTSVPALAVQPAQPPATEEADASEASEGEEEIPAPAPAPTPSAPVAAADATLRTFGGKCFTPPRGDQPQGGGLAAVLLPQLVGAGVDLLTSALEAAGTDRPLSKSTVLPLEFAVECIQIAKFLPGSAADWIQHEDARSAEVAGAPFLLELFLRQSADGSALLLTPTQLNYQKTITGRRTRTKRNLYATITLSDPTGKRTSTVTVPLGDFATRPQPYLFDPMRSRMSGADPSPLGSANSIWIPNPFTKRGPAAAASTTPTTQPQTETSGGFGTKKPPAPTQGSTSQGSGGPPTAPTRNPGADVVPAARVTPGDPISPLSISVTITETRRGNRIARALAGVVKGSRQGVVDHFDPVKRKEAREADEKAVNEKVKAWADARTAYAQKLQAYCAAADAAARRTAAPELFSSQVALSAAATAVERPLPFTGYVDPDTGNNGTALCTGF